MNYIYKILDKNIYKVKNKTFKSYLSSLSAHDNTNYSTIPV